MKIVCDDKIPYISATLESLAEDVVHLPGKDITANDVKDADALIVRTRTHCDEKLLKGSKVQFIATATIGYDHIDTNYCEQAGIYWTNCPGCNAGGVEQYVRECLKLLIRDGIVSIDKDSKSAVTEGKSSLLVVGYGHVGKRVAKAANALGFNVFISDPPLFGDAAPRTFGTLERHDAKEDFSVITFHTPLTRDGLYPTYHLADEAFFKSLKNKPVIINSSRGEVVDNQALLNALETGLVSAAVIDTWENEPDILLPLMEKAYIATPHIAGYSANGKVNADNMVIEALCNHFHLEKPAAILPPDVQYAGYNPRDDHNRLIANPSDFEKLRGNYPIRLE